MKNSRKDGGEQLITYTPIGTVHSPFKKPHDTPIQPSAARDIKATIELFPEYTKGLKDLDGFSHIIIVCHFHLSKEYSLEVVPFMDTQLRGVFATRAPSRPNPIGISVVRLDKIQEHILYIRDVDIVDGTPVLDIKPYVLEFDRRESVKTGWLTENIHKLRRTRDNGRFIK
jgi:tRNA-Thr(GGU) m(6)t(6)A37 methyltransferase TsaA